jgi:hypothetical protein
MDEKQLGALRTDLKLQLLEHLILRQTLILQMLTQHGIRGSSIEEGLRASLGLLDNLSAATDRATSSSDFGKVDDSVRALVADELREIVDDWKQRLPAIARDLGGKADA